MVLAGISIFKGITWLWNKIPPNLRDWSKSEALNFIKDKAPGFFNFCKDKLNSFWAKVPNNRVKSIIDKTTSNFLALNDKIPADVKQRLFEQITGSQYCPDQDSNTQGFSEIIQTDDEKKAAMMQMTYLMAILGGINQKQESMLADYTNALRMTEGLKQEIMDEMKETEMEFAKFVEELSRLDKEFERLSSETQRSKKEANDIINLI